MIYIVEMRRVVAGNNPYLERERGSDRDDRDKVGRGIDQMIVPSDFTQATFPRAIVVLLCALDSGRDRLRNDWESQHLAVGVAQRRSRRSPIRASTTQSKRT